MKALHAARTRLFTGILLGILLAGAAGYTAYLRRSVPASDFKQFAERQIGGWINARVRIQDIRVGFLDEISLAGLEIGQESPQQPLYVLGIEKITFKYHWDRFWSRQFKKPNTVVLDSPRFVLESPLVPSVLLKAARALRAGGRVADEMRFQQGKLGFQLPGTAVRLELKEIEGRMLRGLDEEWLLKFEGKLSGLLNGRVSAEGIVDPVHEHLAFQVTLAGLNSSLQSVLPLTNVNASLRVTENEIVLEPMTFEYSRVPVSVRGRVLDYDTPVPALDLDVSLGRELLETVFAVKGDLAGSSLSGRMRWADAMVPLEGRLSVRDGVLFLEDLTCGPEAQGQGEVDFSSGLVKIYLEAPGKRIDLSLRLGDWNVDFTAQLDHVAFFGADLVTRARFELAPDPELWDDDVWGFNGNLKTDYVILDRVPFPDFGGSFHVAASAVDRMRFQWGRGYELEGSLGLAPPFPIDARIALKGIDFKALGSVFSKPLPSNFAGQADGNVRLRGEKWKVDAEGEIRVHDGSIGEMDYDEVTVRFFGIPPYLKLKDSRLKKGNRVFYLKGGLDLAHENVFHDVYIASSEQISIWRGKDLRLKAAENGR
ncbi:MAG: hypothetical protein HY714_00030 [Candidatus Omnitrophica bacterium]|nr:hypothetical protein [Candidatus Omnitrophota bacterium]